MAYESNSAYKGDFRALYPNFVIYHIIFSIGILANYSDFQTNLALAQQQDNITGNETASTTAAPPVAEAGDDQTISEGTLVQLNGSASRDPDSDMLSFAWNRTSGTPVTLSDESSATPTFTAPDVGAAGGTLTFELTVNDKNGNTATDTVNVYVSDDVASINQGVPIEQSAAPKMKRINLYLLEKKM